LARCVDHLLVDQDGVNHAAHLDQLLPIAAVAREAGDFAGRYRADFAEADLGYHPFEPDARDAARGGSPEIVVHRVDLGPAERHEPIPHGILQRLALAVVQNLVGRRLPHIEKRFACQMVRLDLVRHHHAFLSSWARDRGVGG
jgi:hypothetical protein